MKKIKQKDEEKVGQKDVGKQNGKVKRSQMRWSRDNYERVRTPTKTPQIYQQG